MNHILSKRALVALSLIALTAACKEKDESEAPKKASTVATTVPTVVATASATAVAQVVPRRSSTARSPTRAGRARPFQRASSRSSIRGIGPRRAGISLRRRSPTAAMGSPRASIRTALRARVCVTPQRRRSASPSAAGERRRPSALARTSCRPRLRTPRANAPARPPRRSSWPPAART